MMILHCIEIQPRLTQVVSCRNNDLWGMNQRNLDPRISQLDRFWVAPMKSCFLRVSLRVRFDSLSKKG